MTDNVSKLSDYSPKFMDMKDTLERSLEFIEQYDRPNLRGVVILLDDEQDEYDVSVIKCDMRPSEVVSLLEYVKYYFLEEMTE